MRVLFQSQFQVESVLVTSVFQVTTRIQGVYNQFQITSTQVLNSVEVGDHLQWDVTFRVHLFSQESVLCQVLDREIVVDLEGQGSDRVLGVDLVYLLNSWVHWDEWDNVWIWGVEIGWTRSWVSVVESSKIVHLLWMAWLLLLRNETLVETSWLEYLTTW